ncbi:MAG: phosphatidate cytidylyltransferase [Rikenellaceae bacterium]|nr:phosphatidate cytidylyltransferase [Rikenellaceae bacterium]MBR2451736.1 phosphatidate cytidylyltransferase [Rikenellaceae bacterium]
MTDKTKNLLIRTASGVVLLALVLAATLLNNMWIYAAFVIGISLIATLEFFTLAQKAGAKPSLVVGIVASMVVTVASTLVAFGQIEKSEFMYALADVLVYIPLAFVALLFGKHTNPIASVGATITAPLYIAVPMAMMTLLPSIYAPSDEWNGKIILAYILIVWANDVFAYLFGISFGKHKMCPTISPKKSWEGFVGGVVSACGFGILMGLWLEGDLLLWGILGFVVALSGVAGDLVESVLKRSVGVKDSGNIMPGHGGMLDRFDALFISAPIAFFAILIYNQLF